jgi:hypothetical protein
MFLIACTPNFRSFQTRDNDGTWRDCGEEVELPLAPPSAQAFSTPDDQFIWSDRSRTSG